MGHGNEQPLSAEELVQMATKKSMLDFKRALNELVSKVPEVESGVDHAHGFKTGFSKAQPFEPHHVEENEVNLDAIRDLMKDIEEKVPTVDPDVDFANKNRR